jgi:hypothetical protein
VIHYVDLLKLLSGFCGSLNKAVYVFRVVLQTVSKDQTGRARASMKLGVDRLNSISRFLDEEKAEAYFLYIVFSSLLQSSPGGKPPHKVY